MFTANSSQTAQSYCQHTKDSVCYSLPLPTHDEDLFHQRQILKLAPGTYTEWILNRDKKNTVTFIRRLQKFLQRQNIRN